MTEWIRTGARPQAGLSHVAGGPACSAASRAAGEDLTATASHGRRWLLVEVASGWGWNPWTQSAALNPETGRALARRAQDAGMRIAAIRRTGRARGADRWRWMIIDTAAPSIVQGEVATAEDLLTIPLDGSSGVCTAAPVFIVCTHGKHDECCAVRGRDVAASLAAAYPEETWECSHIGGDRFAATMLLFPHGLNYGRVDETSAPRLAGDYLDGRISVDGYRGRAAMTSVEQAAQAAARSRYGDLRIDAYAPLQSTRLGTDGEQWDIDLRDRSGGTITVRVRRRTGPPTFTTCRAEVAVAVARFDAVAIRRSPDTAPSQHSPAYAHPMDLTGSDDTIQRTADEHRDQRIAAAKNAILASEPTVDITSFQFEWGEPHNSPEQSLFVHYRITTDGRSEQHHREFNR